MKEDNKNEEEILTKKINEGNENLKNTLKKIKQDMEKIPIFSNVNYDNNFKNKNINDEGKSESLNQKNKEDFLKKYSVQNQSNNNNNKNSNDLIQDPYNNQNNNNNNNY
jgi:hypothetical protein